MVHVENLFAGLIKKNLSRTFHENTQLLYNRMNWKHENGFIQCEHQHTGVAEKWCSKNKMHFAQCKLFVIIPALYQSWILHKTEQW